MTNFLDVPPPRITFGHSPLRIIRWGGDDANFVPARCQPLSHFAGEFTDADGFGCVVDAMNQDTHDAREALVRLAVNFAPVSDFDDIHRYRIIHDIADEAVIADTVFPGVFVSLERRADLARVMRDAGFDKAKDTALDNFIQLTKLPASSSGKPNCPDRAAF